MYFRGRYRCISPKCMVVAAGCVLSIVIIHNFRCFGNGVAITDIFHTSCRDLETTPFRHQPFVMCVVYKGRLGKNMFQFAAAFALSKQANLTMVIPDNHQLTKVFNIPALSLSSMGLPEDHCSKVPNKRENWQYLFELGSFKLKNNMDTRIEGYFQSWRYWIDYEDELRKLFTFRPRIKNKAEQILSNIKENITTNSVLVGIHVRAGDLISERRTLASLRYFRKAMHYFRSRYDQIIFLVVSDSFPWCKKVFEKETNLYFMEGNSAEVDLAILSMADHTIASVGAFGWWGGWLAKGTTVYYKPKFETETESRKFDNFVYPGWILMR